MISVIFIHYGQNEARRKLARKSVESLYESVKHLPVEILVVQNCADDDTQYFAELVKENKITTLIVNHSNLWFGRARNQALRIAEGEFLAVVDNDILYKKGWLEKCVEVLEKAGDKPLLATPMPIIKMHKRYTSKEMFDGYKINPFAGSNCWVMRRKDWETIGEFIDHPMAGSKWCRHYAHLGYSVVVVPGGLAEDDGEKGGENHGYVVHLFKNDIDTISISKRLINGEEEKYITCRFLTQSSSPRSTITL